VQSWGKYAGRWTAADIDAALAALLAADQGLKESRLSSDEQMLGTLVLSLCGTTSGAGRRTQGAPQTVGAR
jgi:DNA polymerase-3 subunit delta